METLLQRAVVYALRESEITMLTHATKCKVRMSELRDYIYLYKDYAKMSYAYQTHALTLRIFLARVTHAEPALGNTARQ